VINFEIGTEASSARAELQHAAGVGRDYRFASGGRYRLHFFFEQMLRHFRVGQVVDAGAAAAAIGAVHFHKFQTGDRLQQFSRLAANALAVSEVTRVLVRL